LSGTATAYRRFTSTKISNFGLADRRDVGSNTAQSRHTDFNVLLNKGEILHRARALGEEAYHAAKREFLHMAYDLMAKGLEPIAVEVM
jgi:predicted subunit of tRNA(5-methylaminomethyl-2-thiouridylate) methyltransferase